MLIRFAFHNPIGEHGVGKAIVAWTGFLWLEGKMIWMKQQR